MHMTNWWRWHIGHSRVLNAGPLHPGWRGLRFKTGGRNFRTDHDHLTGADQNLILRRLSRILDHLRIAERRHRDFSGITDDRGLIGLVAHKEVCADYADYGVGSLHLE